MSARKVVILRQADDAAEYIDALRARGLESIAEPILTIEYLDADFSDIDAERPLVFTSAHGVEAFVRAKADRANPVFTVGRNTAQAALDGGFTNVETAAGTVDDLAILLKNRAETGLRPGFYVRAEDVSRDLSGILQKDGINIHEIIAYRAIPAPNLSIELLKSLDKREINAILFFSTRGATIFRDLIEQYGRAVRLKTVRALCISGPVLQSVSVLPFQGTELAETPDRHGMMKLLESISVT